MVQSCWIHTGVLSILWLSVHLNYLKIMNILIIDIPSDHYGNILVLGSNYH